MDMRLTFNEVAPEYDRMRPGYPDALFADALAYSGLKAGFRALEIGIGTGQATLPFLRTGCHLTAIELGDKMAAHSRAKFAAFDRFDVMVADFETVPLADGRYDFVYSAGAFQWIDQRIGYPKILRILKCGGALALMWHRPATARRDQHVKSAIDVVYDRHRHAFAQLPPIPRQHTAELSPSTPGVIEGYGFVDVQFHTYHSAVDYDAEQFTALTSTNCIAIALPDDARARFLQDIYQAVADNGGTHRIDYFTDLYLARKPQSRHRTNGMRRNPI